MRSTATLLQRISGACRGGDSPYPIPNNSTCWHSWHFSCKRCVDGFVETIDSAMSQHTMILHNNWIHQVCRQRNLPTDFLLRSDWVWNISWVCHLSLSWESAVVRVAAVGSTLHLQTDAVVCCAVWWDTAFLSKLGNSEIIHPIPARQKSLQMIRLDFLFRFHSLLPLLTPWSWNLSLFHHVPSHTAV